MSGACVRDLPGGNIVADGRAKISDAFDGDRPIDAAARGVL
jgi:hypothetical protein